MWGSIQYLTCEREHVPRRVRQRVSNSTSVACRYHPPPRKLAIGDWGVIQQLERAGIQVENPMIEMDNQPIVEDQPAVEDGGAVPVKVSEGKPQLFLAVSGLPTVPQKLAQRIWDIDFVEMEEFFPSNRTVQAPEISGLARDRTVF